MNGFDLRISDQLVFSGVNCIWLSFPGDNKRINYVFLNDQWLFTTRKALYLLNLIPPKLNSLILILTPLWYAKNDYLKNLFLHCVVWEWNKLSSEIRNSASYLQFSKLLLSFIKQTLATLFSMDHPIGVKLF